MFKKISIALMVAFLAANSTVGLVLANDQTQHEKPSAKTRVNRRYLVGKVLQVGSSAFEIEISSGKTFTFLVDDETRYAGALSSFGDLEKGMKVGVAAARQEDGTLLAKLVGARDMETARLQKTSGKITQISDASITVLSRQGEQHSFTITEDTRFASRQGDIHGIADLEIGMAVVVVHRPERYEAIALLVADPALLELSRVRGTVQSAGGSHLTIEVQGEKLHFNVDDNTRLRGRGIEDLNDLKNGMKVLVLYIEKDGDLLAKGILVFGPGPDKTN